MSWLNWIKAGSGGSERDVSGTETGGTEGAAHVLRELLCCTPPTLRRFRLAGVGKLLLLPLRSRSDRLVTPVLEELLHHRGVGQRGDVSQVALIAGDLTEHAAHDLPCREAGTRQTGNKRHGRARWQRRRGRRSRDSARLDASTVPDRVLGSPGAFWM